MALLNICRRGRSSWQHALRAASSLHYLAEGPAGIRAPWSPQWFHSSSAAAAADVSVADDAAAPKPPSPKSKSKVDMEEIMNTAERVFGSSMDAQPAGADQAPGASNISPEMVEDHANRVAYTQRKREKYPPKQMLTLEEWLGRHHDALQPFFAFLRRRGVPEGREPDIVSSLFKSGFRGRNVMLNWRHNQPAGASAKPTYEENFDAWNAALAAEDIGLTGEELLRSRWNAMLARTPDHLPATLALLRAAIPNEQQLRAIVADAPRMLGNSPEALQNRLIQLQMAMEGELQHMLVTAPRILETPMDSVLANLRLLRLHCDSADSFRGLITSRPEFICHRPHLLRERVAAIMRELGAALPPGVSAVEIIRQKPELMLARAAWLVQRWKALESAAISMPSWAEELDVLVETAAAYELPQHELAEGEERAAAAALPEFADVAGKAPSEVGVDLAAEKAAALRQQREEKERQGQQQRGRQAYAEMAEALWSRERRFQRLVYLIQELPEEASHVSLIDTLTVRLDRFERRFPEFKRWREHQKVMHMQAFPKGGMHVEEQQPSPSVEEQQQQ